MAAEAPVSAKTSAAATIWTMRVKRHDWEATIEIDSSAPLHLLHYHIQRAVKFDNDHLHMFYMATDSNRQVMEYDSDTPLASVFPLPRKRKLIYLFDFGDSWKFVIQRMRKAPQMPQKGVQYPRLIGTAGEAPQQHGRGEY